MPELPEVETMRRGILSAVGARVTNVQRLPCERKPIELTPNIREFRARAVGQRIDAIERLGKRVIVLLDSKDRIVFEPRMTGLVLTSDAPSEEHLRFQLDTDGKIPSIWYWDRRGLGSVRLLDEPDYAAKLSDRLGPDALQISIDDLRSRLRTSRRAIKVALLDQHVVAGVGNLYASEMLFLAHIHPEKRCDQLTRLQWERLHKAMLDVLNLAIQHEGSTLSDGTYRNALNDPGSFQNYHRVYDREDLDCPDCDARIRRIVQAQRSTFFCPHCQKKSRK